MAARKPGKKTTTTTTVEVPLSGDSTSQSISSSSLSSSPYSPLLPTLLEGGIIALYPFTLLLGSLYSALDPATQNATYIVDAQSYDPRTAPSYFAKKNNVFNKYFVKVGWLWATLAFLLLVFSHPVHGPAFSPNLTRRRLQALLRYASITTIWIFMTQWFFGPAIIDRSFRWTGGQCATMLSQSPEAMAEKAEMGDAREALTHAACKAIGGTWRGGHDISGHVFLLILTSAMLWLEFLPLLLKAQGAKETRLITHDGGVVRSAAVESDDKATSPNGKSRAWGVGVQFAMGVAGLSWWMLFMTAAFFHTWFEKLSGLLVAFSAIYAVYFLPRAVPVLRKVVGMPGI